MYKLFHEELPHPLSDYCQSFTHSYETRQKSNNTLILPKVNTEQGKRSITYCGSEMWNSLHEDVKHKPSVSSFQKALKKKLIEEYN